MSTFKIVLTGIFAACIIFGIAVFTLSKNSSNGELSANLLVWGTVEQQVFDTALKNSSLNKNKNIRVLYVKKDQATFDAEFVEALAEGKGPDIVILREDYIHKHRTKLFTIPYANYPERTFKDTFIEEGELFLSPEGVVAFPFMVDPLVMYWNRDMFTNNLISQPPQYWDEIYGLIEKMTKRDTSANVLESAVAFGEWRNITNAKEIVSMILIQAGTPITARSGTGVTSVLTGLFNYPVAPGQSAMNFYTQFSNPTSPSYTWNRSLPSSINMFLAGNLATYIGFASEVFSIQQKNPNLNFDVTYVPQIRDTNKKAVFGHMYVLALVKQSQQIAGGFVAATAFTEATAIQSLEAVTNLPPVRRDLLSQKPGDAYRAIFYNSALMSKSWIDPDPTKTSVIFRDMIESVTSGRSRLGDALGQANSELEALFR